MAERPEYLTVPEVMARLRLGRTTVYEQARLYLATNGAEGIPCRRFGRSLRFPVAAFDAPSGDRAARNEINVADAAAASNRRRRTTGAPEAHSGSTRRRTRTRRSREEDQAPLPFTR